MDPPDDPPGRTFWDLIKAFWMGMRIGEAIAELFPNLFRTPKVNPAP